MLTHVGFGHYFVWLWEMRRGGGNDVYGGGQN